MFSVSRRALALSLMSLPFWAAPLAAQSIDTLSIGYQKTQLPVIAQQRGVIEAALEPIGVAVEWVEFSAGPPLVEALNVGAVHLGWTGDAPPIFGQAAGADITYVAALPANGLGEGIIAHNDSGIAAVADLVGKKVAVGRGTSAHNLLVAALEANGLTYDQIEPVFLAPADAAAAFAGGDVDAWAVWDPFLAIAEWQHEPNVLARAPDIIDVDTYFLANGTFAADAANTEIINLTIGALGEAATWASENRDAVAQALHEVTGVPLEAQQIAAERAEFGIYPVTADVVAGQQTTADRFFSLSLIPQAVTIADAVWTHAAE